LVSNAATGSLLSQSASAYRFDWGLDGLRAIGPGSHVIIVVDVLSFTSALDVAVSQGAAVVPCPWQDARAHELATRHDALLAVARHEMSAEQPYSLSPVSLRRLPLGATIVLPSPNGSTLAVEAATLGAHVVLAACLRNASAVAQRARSLAGDGGTISVLAAGERWGGTTGPLRPAVEDLLGAGAVLAALDPANAVSAPRCSAEAGAARAAFVSARPRLAEHITSCASGAELVAGGWAVDVAISAEHDVSRIVPELISGIFRAA
jgi:2-phosphosulfolactate phosphatase